jgi:DNA repair exonuclease SbcCD ATPase subunit
MSAYDQLIQKLDAFIRKYYKNMLIKGSIYFFTLFVAAFIFVNTLEYFGQFGSFTRGFIFWSFILFAGYIAVRFIIIPLTKLYKIGKVLNYAQASEIIGTHFTNVQDRLLNTLQLKQAADLSGESTLLTASIEQKINELRPIPFAGAINLKKNVRYVRYAMIPASILVLILIFQPALVSEGSERLVKYNTFFEKKAPFDFLVQNGKLQALQNTDYDLQLKVSGNQLPDEVYVEVDGKSYKMEKGGKTIFHYTFKNLQKNIPFAFLADEYNSKSYELKVIPKPQVLNFEVNLHYPAYIQKPDESIQNTGDLSVPSGTEITWRIATTHVEELNLQFADKSALSSKREDDLYIFKKRMMASQQYSIRPANRYIKGGDSVLYTISVSPDAFPMVDAEEQKDSLNSKVSYFSGNISDDYGLSRLTFNYHYTKSGSKEKQKKGTTSIPLAIDRYKAQQPFYYLFNISELGVQPGDEIEYYFEVWDNDGVWGSKATRSKALMFKAPTIEEIKQQAEQGSKEMKKDMNEAMKDASKLQKDLKKLQEKLAEKKQLTWEDKKQVEELLKRQKELEQQIKEIQQEHQQNMQQKQEYNKQDEQMMEKQMELQKLMDQVMDEEMKKLMQEFEELLKQNDKDVLKDKLSEMQVQDKEVQKELDRMLEMYKKLEIEEKREKAVDKLDELTKDQEKLSEESKDKNADNKELEKKQDDLNKKFDELQKDLKDIEKKNEELEKPEDMEKTEEEEKQIDQDQKESKDELSKDNKSGASKKQKKAADNMKKMSEKMKKDMKKKEQEGEEEDYNNLRQILENLLKLSFDQEALMEELKTVNGYNPEFVKIGQKQKKLKDDAKLIEDSLFSLSKRQIKIQSIINKEIIQINANMERAIGDMADRNIYSARNRQQYVMTHVNNLAVMLSQVLKQMQDEMNGESKSSASGSGEGKKKGKKKGQGEGDGGSKGMKGLRQMQEDLAKQIEQMKKGMKPGQQGQPGQNGMPGSKEFAQAAATQAAIRQKMRALSQQFGKEGATQLQKQLDQIQKMMDQTEKELYNKQITPELMKRQQEIVTRMLDSEKAQQERETDKERKATSGDDKINIINPQRFEEFVKQKNKENEILRTVPPNLTIYYRNKVKLYFDKMSK